MRTHTRTSLFLALIAACGGSTQSGDGLEGESEAEGESESESEGEGEAEAEAEGESEAEGEAWEVICAGADLPETTMVDGVDLVSTWWQVWGWANYELEQDLSLYYRFDPRGCGHSINCYYQDPPTDRPEDQVPICAKGEAWCGTFRWGWQDGVFYQYFTAAACRGESAWLFPSVLALPPTKERPFQRLQLENSVEGVRYLLYAVEAVPKTTCEGWYKGTFDPECF